MGLTLALGMSLKSSAGGSGGVATPTILLSATSIAEGSATGTEIGTLSIQNSPDGVTWTFSIEVGGDPDSKFQLDSVDDTILEVGGATDYETATSHSLTITATPSEGDAIERTFAISVTNVADVAPSQFGSGDWSVANLGTNGDIRITIASLPSAGDSPITDLEYQVDGGSWVSMARTTTGTHDVGSLTDGTEYDIAVRAVNAAGNGTASATKAVTPTGVPSAFTAGQWSVASDGSGTVLTVTVSTLPATGGSAITDVEYRIDAGSWVSGGISTTTTFDIEGLTQDVEVTVELRAVNANGAGGDSDDKTATPTEVTDDDMVASLTVNTDGWSADIVLAGTVDGGSYSGLNNKASPGLALSVTSTSWTTGGVETTISRTIYATSVVRLPYPDNASLDEVEAAGDLTVRVSLSDYIYADDTVTAVNVAAGFYTDDGTGGASDANSGGTVASITNSSTRAYVDPQAFWMAPHHLQRFAGDSVTVKLFVMHRHAQQGQPVRAVAFTADDVTGSGPITPVLATATTSGQYTASGLYACWYEATLDLSALVDGELITIDATIYPWVGDAYTLSTDAETYPSPNLTVRKVVKGVAPLYASVDGTGAGTPATSSSSATADTTPYSSIANAASALQTANGGTLQGCVIRILGSTTVAFGTLSARTWGSGELLIEGVDRVTSIITDNGANTFGSIVGSVRFSNLTLRMTSANVFIDHGSATAAVGVTCEEVTFDLSAGSATYLWFYRAGNMVFDDCDGDWCGQGHTQINAASASSYIGCDMFENAGVLRAYNLVANRMHTPASSVTLGGNYLWTAGPLQGGVMAFNSVSVDAVGAAAVDVGSHDHDYGDRGLALVGNVIEYWGAGGQVGLNLAQIEARAFSNVTEAMNTVVGGRTNVAYNTSGGVTVTKDVVSRHSVHYQMNIKADVLGTDADYIGAWPVRHGVGGGRCLFLAGDTLGSTAPLADGSAWLGEGLGDAKTSFPVGTLNSATADFADDQSKQGGNAGGGDYTPGASTDIPTIPAGETMFATDLFGTAIPTDGSALAGAVQSTA